MFSDLWHNVYRLFAICVTVMTDAMTLGTLINSTSSVFDIELNHAHVHRIYAKHEFATINPWTALPTVLLLFSASVAGTFGNILILLAVLCYKDVRTVESMFIVNLAFSDLYVNIVADPMSIVGKLLSFFEMKKKSCQ